MKRRRARKPVPGRRETPIEVDARLARTREQAEKVLETFPKSMLGIPRPIALVMISGFAALVRDGIEDEEMRRETEHIEAVCFDAAMADLPRFLSTIARPPTMEPEPAPSPPVNVTWPEAWMRKHGGRDVRPA